MVVRCGGDIAGNTRGRFQWGGEIDAVKAGGGVASAVPGEPGGGRVENTKSIREIVNMNIVSKERNTSTNKTIIFKISSISNTIEITY